MREITKSTRNSFLRPYRWSKMGINEHDSTSVIVETNIHFMKGGK